MRLLLDGEGDGPWNMAVDETLLEWTERTGGTALRLYGWRRPTITVGRNQNVERTLDLAACHDLDVPIVRRLTGGRGVLHGEDLTVSLCAPASALGFRPDAQIAIRVAYARILQPIAAALADTGYSATQGTCAAPRVACTAGDCFTVRSEADLVSSHGEKLVGGALYVRGGHLLAQLSIPTATGQEALHYTDLQRQFFGSARNAPQSLPDRRALEAVLVRSMSAAFGTADAAELSADERERADWLTASRYANVV